MLDAASRGEVQQAEPDVVDVTPETPAGVLAVVEHDLATVKAKMDLAIKRAQAQIEFMADLRKLIIANSRHTHWQRFGDRIVPDGPECHRLRTLLAISVTITEPKRQDYEDEDGKYYIYSCMGRAELAGLPPVEAYGAASSRTQFFARSHGEYVKSKDINPAFIAKMAWTDCHSKCIQGLLALKVDPDELQGITGQQVENRAPERSRAAADTPDQAEHRGLIRAMILELTGENKAEASGFLEYLTTFQAKDGKWVRGKKTTDALTQPQVENLYKRKDLLLTSAKLREFRERQTDAGS